MTNEEVLPIKRINCGARTQHRSVGAVAHSETEVVNQLVQDESLAVKKNVVHCASISHNKANGGAKVFGRDGLQ